MYIDIMPNDNLPEPHMATFKETSAGKPIAAVRLHLDDGVAWCAITGWNDGPTTAWWTPIEESGDGPARLASGGDHGLRLARIASPEAAAQVRWDVADATQWAEPFLICRPETETHA